MTPLLPAAYLAAVVWAIIGSSKRWMTTLWIVLTLAIAIAVLFVCSLIWPFETGVLGHQAAPVGMIASGLAGIGHMRAHRRPTVPKVGG